MKNEVRKPQMFYTSPDWVNRLEFPLSEWPPNRKRSGVKSRLAAGSTNRVKSGIRRLERMGLL